MVRRLASRRWAVAYQPVRRRLLAKGTPLMPGLRSSHPLELTLGMEAGVATPALAKRVGRWAADHTQRQVLEMVQHDHGVHWSCATLRKLLSSLSAGMATHRQVA